MNTDIFAPDLMDIGSPHEFAQFRSSSQILLGNFMFSAGQMSQYDGRFPESYLRTLCNRVT